MPIWWGLAVGAGIGVFFGLMFGGNQKWKFWDHIFGPEAPIWKDDQGAWPTF